MTDSKRSDLIGNCSDAKVKLILCGYVIDLETYLF